jgi:hypothetical protein
LKTCATGRPKDSCLKARPGGTANPKSRKENMLNVNIISPKDNWILQKIASELMEVVNQDIVFSQSRLIKPKAINYYINWKYWKYLYPGLDKSKCDVVWFTHFDEGDTTKILQAADYIVAKSQHGRKCLLGKGIDKSRIKVLAGIGPSPDMERRKVKLGISGRPYPQTGRKGEDELIQLSKDLDSSIFQFVFSNNRWQPVMDRMAGDCIVRGGDFWQYIDYWLSTSTAEGGPMDVINAFYASIPVISRNIGFFYSMKCCEDFAYSDYGELLLYLKNKEHNKKDKITECRPHTWDNFRAWHIKLFKEIM